MKLNLQITNLVIILLIDQTCFVMSDGMARPSASSIRLNFEIDVPDPQIKMKISQLFNADKKKVSKYKLKSSEEGNPADIMKSVFGFLESLIDPIADAIDQKLAHDWVEYVNQLNRTREKAEKEHNEAEDHYNIALRALESVDQLVELKEVCSQKCDAWCSAMECRTPNCPEVPDDVKKCAKLPLCQPYWRCNLEVVGNKSNSSIIGGEKSRRSSKSYNSDGKTLRKRAKKSGKKFKVERVKRSALRIEGADKCSQSLKELGTKNFLKGSFIEEFYKTVKDFSERVKKAEDKAARESLCRILEYYGENFPCKDNPDQSINSKQVEDGVAAVFYHAFLKKSGTDFVTKTKSFKKISCPPCRMHCPHLLLSNCSYTCPNLPDCDSYFCNCI